MKIAAVILNYQDAKGTVDALRRIDGFFCLDRIVLVDNASADGSAGILEQEAENASGRVPVTFVQSGRNGGYGAGNNLGVRTAAELGADLVLIANPDAVFDEKLVKDMAAVFQWDPAAAVCGAVMHEGEDRRISWREYLLSGWKRRKPAEAVLHGGPVMGRVLREHLDYSFAYYKKGEAERGRPQLVRVYAVHGSLLMVAASKFLEMGGFDEEMFLYGEENVLAEKALRSGYPVYLLKETYRHAGSVSITGAGFGAVRRQKLRNQSELCYYRKYLGMGKAGMAAARLFQAVVMLETRIAERLHLI